MNRTWAAAPLIAVVLLAGCKDSTSTTGTAVVAATPSASEVVPSAVETTPAAAPSVPKAGVCMVGSWVSTGFDISAGKLHETGGAGVRMTIARTGAAKVVYDGMKPVRFSGQATGTVLFHGSTTGAVKLPAAGATEGKWATTKSGGVSGLTADVAMTSPAKVTMKKLEVGKLAGSFAGASAPQLTVGTWRCTGDTLVSTAPASSGVHGSWTLTREN